MAPEKRFDGLVLGTIRQSLGVRGVIVQSEKGVAASECSRAIVDFASGLRSRLCSEWEGGGAIGVARWKSTDRHADEDGRIAKVSI